MTLFVNILRDPRNRKAREDLQSLNMAATFFTSLMPGDSPCNYAKFMATMCTNFERVARMLVEREEKTIKDRQPTEKQQPPRPLRRTTHHHPRHPDPQPPSQPGPSPGIGIPNLEGFPPINSSGYVVPRSPSISTNPSSTNINSPLNVPPAGIQPSPPGDPNPPNPPPFPLDNVFSTDPSSSAPSLPFPEFWQIPLTADWEFGNQFLGGFFAHNSASASSSACQYQQQQQQQPFLPAFSQGYFFDCSNPDSVPGQDSNLDSNMWSGSF